MGGSPTTSANRRDEGGARHADLLGQHRHSPGDRGTVLQHPQRPAHHRISLSPEPSRRLGWMTREPSPQHRDQQQVEQPVEDRLLSWLVFDRSRPRGSGEAESPKRLLA